MECSDREREETRATHTAGRAGERPGGIAPADGEGRAGRRTWFPPEPEHVLDLAARPGARLVQNGDQLLTVLVESLERLEKEKLQGETPMAPALWNQAGKSYTPKGEDWFTDYVKQHLGEDLRGRGLVLNREVVIRAGEGEGRGERTDLRVDALLISESEAPESVTVIVEAKGCWNDELATAMEEQLAHRYLADNASCRHGLYLVGWFNCGQWDKDDWRWRQAPRYGLDAARERFAEQARVLSEGGPRIRAVVVNAALR